MDTKEGARDIYKLARVREKKIRDLGNIKCIKSEDNIILVREDEIKESWKNYFYKLHNENPVKSAGLDDTYPRRDILY